MQPSSTAGGSEEPSYPIARRAHKKSKYGCRSCKQRRVKCDEQRPVCGNCVVHFVNVKQCEYDEGGRTVRSNSPAMKNRVRNIPQRSRQSGPRTADLSPNTQLSSPKELACSAVDPFATHPESKEPQVNRLIHVYFSAQVFNVFPYYPTPTLNPVREYFAPLIWKDSVLFHVTLLLGAFHLEKNTLEANTSRLTRLRSKCLQLLQERVNQPLPESTSDETISAVAGMATLEHEQGNPRLTDIHMRGLRRILSLRGGIATIRESNPVVAHMLFCLFLAVANGNFPTTDLEQPIIRPPWVYEALEEETSESGIDFESHGVTSPYAELLVNIRMLAKTYRTADDCETSAEYQGVLSFLCATLQRLLELPPPCNPSGSFTYSVSVTNACRQALISHVFAQWCTHAPDPSLIVRAAQQGLLENLRPILANRISNKLVLWLLCVGASSAVVPAESKWFVSQLVGVMEDLEITTWSHLSTCLQQVIWHQRQDEGLYRQLWDEMVARKKAFDN